MLKKMITHAIEALTALTSILLFAASETSIWFGFLGLAVMIILAMETNVWEGGV